MIPHADVHISYISYVDICDAHVVRSPSTNVSRRSGSWNPCRTAVGEDLDSGTESTAEELHEAV